MLVYVFIKRGENCYSSFLFFFVFLCFPHTHTYGMPRILLFFFISTFLKMIRSYSFLVVCVCLCIVVWARLVRSFHRKLHIYMKTKLFLQFHEIDTIADNGIRETKVQKVLIIRRRILISFLNARWNGVVCLWVIEICKWHRQPLFLSFDSCLKVFFHPLCVLLLLKKMAFH